MTSDDSTSGRSALLFQQWQEAKEHAGEGNTSLQIRMSEAKVEAAHQAFLDACDEEGVAASSFHGHGVNAPESGDNGAS